MSKDRKELEEELCEYCEVETPGVTSGPNGPIFHCSERSCEEAYANYLAEVEEFE